MSNPKGHRHGLRPPARSDPEVPPARRAPARRGQENDRGAVGRGSAPRKCLLQGDEPGNDCHPDGAHDAQGEERQQRAQPAADTPRAVRHTHCEARPTIRRARHRPTGRLPRTPRQHISLTRPARPMPGPPVGRLLMLARRVAGGAASDSLGQLNEGPLRRADVAERADSCLDSARNLAMFARHPRAHHGFHQRPRRPSPGSLTSSSI